MGCDFAENILQLAEPSTFTSPRKLAWELSAGNTCAFKVVFKKLRKKSWEKAGKKKLGKKAGKKVEKKSWEIKMRTRLGKRS